MSNDHENLDDLPDEENDAASRMRLHHDLYQRAVNHPIRHRILEMVSATLCSENELLARLQEEALVDDEKTLHYHLDYLLKAQCIEVEQDEKGGGRRVSITQGGQVIDYLE